MRGPLRPLLVRTAMAALLAVSLGGTACQRPAQNSDPAIAASPTQNSDAAIAAGPAPLNEHDTLVAAEILAFAPPPNSDGISPAALAAYGTRAGFFTWAPKTHRPDLDWRTALGDWLADADPQWSQGYEELIIRDYFHDKRDGFFLDVGCFRPKYASTTYYLEKNLGWTGIAIDAMAEHATEWKEHRPNSTFESYAVSDSDGDTVTFHVGYIANALNEAQVRAFGGKKAEIEVTTMTLDTLLEKHGVEKVDFLSMDIEGAEPAALKAFDIERYRPELCCVEGVSSEQVLEYFAAHGYEVIEKYRKADKINLYFRPKRDAGP